MLVPHGIMGSPRNRHRGCLDLWRCAVSALQLVMNSHPCCPGFCSDLSSIISFICTICIALSLSEIASIYPTAGGKSRRHGHLIEGATEANKPNFSGQYHWVAAMSPPSTRSAAAWATGWISVWGQAIFSASAAFAAGLEIQGLIIMNNDLYTPTRWQGMLLYWAVVLYSTASNIWGLKVLPTTNMVSGALLCFTVFSGTGEGLILL
jgi:choline transport protein